MAYNKAVTRAGVDATIPEEVEKSLLKKLSERSVVLSHARLVPMARGVARLPALAGLAQAFFVNGDSGFKQTTDISFTNKELIAEEIATLLVIPDNVDADSEEDLWEWAETECVNALFRLIDEAILFGHDRTTWPAALAAIATTAGNSVVIGTATAAQGGATGDLDELIGLVESDGGEVTDIVASRRLKGALRKARTTAGEKLTASLNEYEGIPIDYAANPAFPVGLSKPVAIALDFSKVLIGLRADVTVQVFDSGVISDPATGAVVYNAMQQDGKVMRVTIRLAYQVDDTLTAANRHVAAGQRAPVAVLLTPAV